MKKRIMMLLLAFALVLFVAGCNGDDDTTGEDTTGEDTTEETTGEDTTEEDEDATDEETKDITIKTMYGAPHGERSFSATFVVMDGDVVSHVKLDEYQFMDSEEVTGVPNSDAAFGEGSVDGISLISKLENDAMYSENMEKAGSTITYANNMAAIEDFAKGKTLADIEQAISDLGDLGEDDSPADVVSGATFVDTDGYLQAIVDTANDGLEFTGVDSADLSNAELSYSLQAPHGERAFAVVSVLHDGDKVLAATLDEFQYLDPADFEGVPNSDGAFGENYSDGVVLASKNDNDVAYSANMANAGATLNYLENIQLIIDHAVGSTVEEIEATISELDGDVDIADVVSGATFVDTNGYLQAIVDTIN